MVDIWLIFVNILLIMVYTNGDYMVITWLMMVNDGKFYLVGG